MSEIIISNIDPGYLVEEVLLSEFSINGKKVGTIIEYDPISGEVKIQIDLESSEEIESLRSNFDNIKLETESTRKLQELKTELALLSDDERLKLFSDYCKYCGCNDPACQCWNDD